MDAWFVIATICDVQSMRLGKGSNLEGPWNLPTTHKLDVHQAYYDSALKQRREADQNHITQ